jgi:hypothetical protein
VRIRWRGVARVAAIFVVGLIALSVVPRLLRAPGPPPLGRDVGLPKAAVGRPVRVIREPSPPRRRKPRRRNKSRARHHAVPDAPAATAKIGTRTRRHHARRSHRSSSASEPTHFPGPEPGPEPVESAPPPAPEYVAPAPPEPAPTPLPEPPPTPESVPGDGSEEFAPH